MFELEKLGMSSEDASSLLQALDEGAVNLLTGAGASYGVEGGDKVKLAGGPDLATELNKKFLLDNAEPDSSNLQLVYGDIYATPLHRPQLAEFLRGRFTNCAVSWQGVLFSFPWKRIWTLNIDDVLQRAGGVSSAQIKPFSWDEPLSVRPRSGMELQVVYLHGRASQIDSNLSRLIFSLQEYAARHEISPGWHAEFRSEFIRKPFLICGARLKEEFDLATVLGFGNKSGERGGCPSFIVLREFAPGEESRFRRQGLVPVAATGEIFFAALYADLILLKQSRPPVTPVLQAALIAMRSAFKLLTLADQKPKRTLDFYSSAEAQWSHIVEHLDARLDGINIGSRWLQDKKNDVRIFLIGGGAVCGKSTSAYRIAASLLEQGYEAWIFRAEERFDEKAVCEYLFGNKNTVLIFDDCADFSSSVAALAASATDQKIRLRVVASAENWRLRGIKSDLHDFNVNSIQLEPVSRSNFESIYTVRQKKGRLGRCTNLNVKDAWLDFRDHYNKLMLEWLESLEGVKSFKDIISDILQATANRSSAERRLVLACAASHRFGYSLPYQLASALCGRQELEEFVGEDGPYADLAFLDEKGLRLRSRSFASHVWNLASRQERYEITLYLARQLSPLVFPQAIARRTYSYRIIRELMSCDVVAEDLRDLAEQWYADLLPEMGWNSRYWEQRALLAAKLQHADTAYSFAKKAVSIQSNDAFSHTTLGTICMQISIRRADEVGVERFWEGEKELKISRGLAIDDGTEWEHPYVTFFTYALRACRIYPTEFSKISQAWAEWERTADYSKLFKFDVQGQRQLLDFKRQWLSLAVRRS